jgi:hypothetical protein
MHQLAGIWEAERRRTVDDFLDDVLGGHDVDPDLATRMRSARPDLPGDPSRDQVEARIELAQLIADTDFRRRIRGMSERAGDRSGPQTTAAGDRAAAGAVAQLVAERAGATLAAGVDRRSNAAAPIVDELVGAFAGVRGRADDRGHRARLAELLETFTDARAERYWQLLAVINGWPVREPAVPAWEWLATALHERP